MANSFSVLIKKKLVGKNQNLLSLDEPYEIMKRLLKSHDVSGILDAGASHGNISRRMLKKFPNANVYAFEPQPKYKSVLEQYAKKDSRFHPQFAALSDHEGTAELNVTEAAGNASLLNPMAKLKQIDPEGSRIKETVSVPVTTIDQWAAQNGHPAIHLMKFDIQGYELKALKGAVQTLSDSTLIVYSEVWFNPVYENTALFSDIDSFLRGRGFLLYDIYKPKYSPGKLVHWANAMFVHAKRMGIE